jgi:riboflavin kinase/FMN adenylyltransferase
MLGRWFSLEGAIVQGAGRGKKLTVPTLNIETANELIPRFGVYITRIGLDDGPSLDSITNIGVRPTFGDGGLTIETFVLHEAVPEHPVTASLQFMRRVRDEIKFESPEALRRQIALDVRTAERFFRLLNIDRHAGSRSR